MTAGEIYKKTLYFSWVKLGIYLVTAGLSIVAFAILYGISYFFESIFVYMVSFVAWLAFTSGARAFIQHIFGYVAKAGHIAVITESIETQKVPEKKFKAAKEMVEKRFGTTSAFFLVDSLVAGSVRQIQRTIGKLGSFLDFVPGINTMVGVLQKFAEISLGYIDECCLGYVFLNKEEDPFKMACDGVVIYTQNWKTLLKNAAKITAVTIVAMIVLSILVFLVIGGLFKALHWPIFIALLLSFYVAAGLKYAFVDSWILISTMVCYMEVAPETEISYDLYEKLSSYSGKFKELFQKAKEKMPSQPLKKAMEVGSDFAQGAKGAIHSHLGESTTFSEPEEPLSGVAKFCSACGGKLQEKSVFCSACGTQIK